MAKKTSGGKRIGKEGRKLIWVTADAEEMARIRTAASFEGKAMSKFLLDAGLAAAEKIWEKIRKTT